MNNNLLLLILLMINKNKGGGQTNTPTDAEVPNVIDKDQESAEKAIRNQEFNPKVGTIYCTKIEGVVVKQDPVGGSFQPIGSDVKLFVSLGPQPEDELTDHQQINASLKQIKETEKQILEAVKAPTKSAAVATTDKKPSS